jgi:Asp-tRNA(Asn)/Glu-tRNA(Gln) amidotransferase C subunit
VTEKITKEIFDHLVDLAALELDDEEAKYLRSELNNQLQAIYELEAILVDEETWCAIHGTHSP